MYRSKRIVIKVGTHVITQKDGKLNHRVMRSITQQIMELYKRGFFPLLISSGAMGAGLAHIKLSRKGIPESETASFFSKKMRSVASRQVLASVGQVYLIEEYRKLFQSEGVHCAQLLITKEDFRDRHHYLNMRSCLEALFHYGIIPILNENDAISIEALMFTDNDELAGLIASMLDADLLLLLTNVDGIFSAEERGKSERKVIPEIDPSHPLPKGTLTTGKSIFGRGGMHSKYAIGKKMANIGIRTHILNGKKEENILRIIEGKESCGTRFIPKKSISSVKKWLAHGEGMEKGEVYINARAEEAISSESKANSLLFIGIKEVSGFFQKGDLITIYNEKRKKIGLGMCKYSSENAKKYLGQKRCPPFIHYDYLYLF